MIKFRATSGFIFHEKMMKPGDIGVGTDNEFEWLRGADCAIKICDIEPDIKTAMIDTESRTEKRIGRPRTRG